LFAFHWRLVNIGEIPWGVERRTSAFGAVQLGKPVILLGAGASKDAGLPDTYELTRQVYDSLNSDHLTVHSKLFGYVIAKLTARGVLSGHSPFDKINIEDAYDGLTRLLNRDNDFLSDFVYSWDPILESFKKPFSSVRFQKSMSGLLKTRRRLGGGETIAIDGRHVRSIGDQLAASINGSSRLQVSDHILGPFLDALADCLSIEPSDTDYLIKLASYAANHAVAVASLNYDTIFDTSATDQGLKIDYGLTTWNAKKIVQWSKADLRLLKLHGSLNWYAKGENILVDPPEDESSYQKMMIFGGLNAKLNPDGPYLQLRYHFENLLLKTNVLVVIGYSFRDAHMNSVIRRWVSSRRKAKMIIVDPGDLQLTRDQIGHPYARDKEGVQSKTVEVCHLKRLAKDSIQQIVEAVGVPPNLEQQRQS
jgi:hypothetical protein